MNKDRHRMAVAAHLLLRNANGEILFLRRANTGYADGQWSVPAGHVEQNETLVAACVRETAEEITVAVAQQDLECVLVQHKHDLDGEERIDVFFRCDLTDGQQARIAEPDCCDGLKWADPLTPPQPTVPYVGAALAAINAATADLLSYFGFENADYETIQTLPSA
jgi:8-oxo-dGTP diphosphatase